MTESVPTTAPPRRGPWRWLVAGIATAALVASGSGLVVFAQSGAGESRGPQFVPADATAYVEARLDMPDGQSDALAQFMTAFPGFADAGAFELKLDEVIDGLMGQMSDGTLSYTGQLDQVITGEMGLGIMDIDMAAMEGGDPDMIVGVAISDPAAAGTIIETLMSQSSDGETSQETYGDTTIVNDDTTAVAVTDEWVLLAPDADQVKAGIDVLEGTTPSLAADPDFSTAFARLPAGRLGAAYLDIQSLIPLIEAAAASTTVMTVPVGDLAAMLPKDLVAALVAEDDRLTLLEFITPGESMMDLPVGESDVANLFPADTQLYLETRELGMTLQGSLEGLFATMGEEGMAELAPIESMLGESLPSFLDFVGDAGVGAGISSGELSLGIVAEVTDEEVASTRLERVLSVVRLFAGSDSGISIEETSVGDEAVTVVTLPIDEMAGGALPVAIADSFSIALADGNLLIGLGDFVETALTQDAATSLAASESYVDALAGDTPNSGVLYANVGSLLAELDPMLSAMIPQWAQIAPYATGVDGLIAVGTAAEDVISARISVIVDQ